MKKIIITLLLVLLANPIGVFAQVFNQSQVILPTYGGFIVATSTTGTSKLSATTTPFFNFFNFNTATGTSATTTNLFSTTASSTSLFSSLFQGGGISACNTTTGKLIWSGGYFSCGTDFNTGGSSFNWPFDFTSGNAYVSTTTNIGFLGSKGIFTTGSSTLNTLLVNSSSTLQNFTFINATGTSATTTNFFATTASTTNLSGTSITGFNLSTCTGTNALTWTGGLFTCTAQPQGTVTSVSGTTNRITSTGGATPVIDISASYVGQASITTVGTLSSGAVPASLITAGTFGSGNYIFPAFLTVLGSTTLQNFTAINATTSQATTTNLSVGTLFRSGTTDGCGTWAGGVLGSTGSACGSGGASFAWPFSFTSGNTYVSTTTDIGFLGSKGIFATGSSTLNTLLVNSSSTLQNFTGVNATTTNATTTSLAVSNLVSCDTIDTTSTGSFVCGTDSSGGSGAYPFALTGNATSTLTQFNGGLTAYASSTIGAGGTLTGLTVNGTATTTGNLVVRGTATSTFAGTALVTSGRALIQGSGTTIPYVPTGGGDPSYFIINRSSSAQDGSLLYYTNGTCNWEIGMPGDGDMHWKSCTGTDANAVFTDRLFMSSTTGAVGYGTSQPTGQLEVATSAPTGLAQLTVTNKNPGAGSTGAAVALYSQTSGNVYYLRTDPGANGNKGLTLNDGTFCQGLWVDSSNNVGIQKGCSNFASTALSVGGAFAVTGSSTLQNFTAVNATTSTLVVGNCTDPGGNTGLFISVCGTDNTTAGINAGITNKSSGTSAYSTFYFQNNLADASLAHLAGASYNGSNYTDTTFGTAFAVKNQFTLFNFDGLVSIISSTSTTALNDAGINFVTGGNAAANERARITTSGYFLIGTTTNSLGQLTVATSTAPQIHLSDGIAGDTGWAFRNAGGFLYLSSTTASFATSSAGLQAMTVKPTGTASFGFGTSTFNGTAGFGPLVANGSTTISMGKIQFDGYNSAGTRSCTMLVGTAFVTIAGGCTP